MVSSLFSLINNLARQSVFLDWLMIIIAEYFIVFIAGFLIYLFIKTQETKVSGPRKSKRFSRERKNFIFVFLAMIVSLIISKLIGFLFYTPRPFINNAVQLIDHVADSSFPSDHGVAFFSLGFALLLIKQKKTGIGFLILGLLVGFARIFAGLHYPLDIFGSLIVAFIGVILVWLFFRKKV